MPDRRHFLKVGAAGIAAAAAANLAQAQQKPEHSLGKSPLDEVTIAELQQMMRSGRYTSERLVEIYSQRIAEIDHGSTALSAVIEMNPDAPQIARQCDQERAAGKRRGPLHGVPVLIKDNIATNDRMQTTAGSLALMGAGAPHQRDAFVAAQLRRAGAVILGKTNLSEWANFRSTHSTSGWSGRGGQTKCAYALDRNPSGSSSGSGAGVSANLCAVAIGTETDGSIVSPACSNGVVGIKPTVGLVSRANIVPISHTQDTAGPMARTVTDAAILLNAIAGVDADDAATSSARGHIDPDYTRSLDANGLRGMRVGVIKQYMDGYKSEVLDLFKASVEALKKAGAEVIDDVDVPTIGKWDSFEQLVLLYEFKANLNAYLAALGVGAKVRSLEDVIHFNSEHAREEMPFFGQELLLQAQAKGDLTSQEYLDALAKCRQMTRADGIDTAMDKNKLDALICPTGAPAWITDWVDGDNSGPSASSIAAVAGYPHVTVPMGSAFGLPVGISFIGRAWSESVLIKAAFAYEQATKHRRPPTLASRVDLQPR